MPDTNPAPEDQPLFTDEFDTLFAALIEHCDDIEDSFPGFKARRFVSLIVELMGEAKAGRIAKAELEQHLRWQATYNRQLADAENAVSRLTIEKNTMDKELGLLRERVTQMDSVNELDFAHPPSKEQDPEHSYYWHGVGWNQAIMAVKKAAEKELRRTKKLTKEATDGATQ